jgi:hypothetical protein
MTEEKIDLTKNAKQGRYFADVMGAVMGLNQYRYFAYGGAIRGGKTFVTLSILVVLAKRFPGSRWHVVRATNTVLRTTTLESFMKLKPAGVRMLFGTPIQAIFPNGSAIVFMSENIQQNPGLEHFLGLETNGIFLEQAEEIDEKTWEMAKQRTGSWTMPPDRMPPALIFTTFNPSDTWSRRVFYDPFKSGDMRAPYYYLEALPKDSPYVTGDQWASWSEMDDVSYKMFINGDWDARRNDNAFYFAFSRTLHVKECGFSPELPVHLSFDQNVIPYLSLSCWQLHADKAGVQHLRCFDEFPMRPPHATSGAAAMAFREKYPSATQVYIYGDASGNKRDTREMRTDYDIIKSELRGMVHNRSDRTLDRNPSVWRRREWINNILGGKYANRRIEIDPACAGVARDYFETKVDANGNKHKNVVTGNDGQRYEEHGHLSDTGDYLMVKIWEDDWLAFTGNRIRMSSNAG